MKLGSSTSKRELDRVDEEEMGKVYDFIDGEQIEDTRFVSQDGNISPRTVLETVAEFHADKVNDVVVLAEGNDGFYLFSSSSDQRAIAFLLQLGLDRVMERYKDD